MYCCGCSEPLISDTMGGGEFYESVAGCETPDCAGDDEPACEVCRCTKFQLDEPEFARDEDGLRYCSEHSTVMVEVLVYA